MKLEVFHSGYYDRSSDAGLMITVRLSRRNLKSLLAKLDNHPNNSYCTLSKGDVGYGNGKLVVIAEEDDIHYGEVIPGEMHPDTEEVIND